MSTPDPASVFQKPALRPPLRALPDVSMANRGGPAPTYPIQLPSSNVPESNEVSTAGFGYMGSATGRTPAVTPASTSYFGTGQATSPQNLARLQAMLGAKGDDRGMLDFVGEALGGPVSGALTWASRGPSAVAHYGSGLGNLATGDLEQAKTDFINAAKSAGKFVEPPLKYIGPQGVPIITAEIVRGKPLDLTPGDDPPVLWPSDTLLGQKITGGAAKVPVIGGALEFGAGMGLDILGDPLSWTGVGAAGTIARQGARRTVFREVEKRLNRAIDAGNPLEVAQKDYVVAAGKTAQAADAVEPHLTLYGRVPFSRTPIPWRKKIPVEVDRMTNVAGIDKGKSTGRRWVNANTLGVRQKGYKPKMRDEGGNLVEIDTSGISERGLGYGYTFRTPGALRFATRYTKKLSQIAAVDEKINRKKAGIRAYAGDLYRPTKGERFGDWLRDNRKKIKDAGGVATGRAQHAAKTIDDFLGATVNPYIKSLDKTAQLTSASASHARDLAAGWAMSTKLMNAVSNKVRDDYLQPVLKTLASEKIDEHWFYRMVDDPTNPEYSIKAYAATKSAKPEKQAEIVQKIQEAYRLHKEMDEKIMRFAHRNGLLPDGAWQDYVPRYGKDLNMSAFLKDVDRYTGPRRAALHPTRKGFEYPRINPHLADIEAKFEERTAAGAQELWERPPTARNAKHPYKSNIVETEYSVAMMRHINDLSMAVAQRNLYHGLMDLRGGTKRAPKHLRDEIDALTEEQAALRADIKAITSRDRELIKSERVTTKDTEAETKEASAELRGSERAFHEAPSKRGAKVNSFRNTLQQLAKSALKRSEEGYDPNANVNKSVEVKHAKLRAKAEEQARELGELAAAASSPDQVGDIARAAMRAVHMADQGQVAMTAEIMGLVDKRIDDMAAIVQDKITTGAGYGAPARAVTGPGMLVRVPGKWVRDFPLEEFGRRLKAQQTFGIEALPMKRVRAGMRSARAIRQANAEAAARRRGEWATSPDGNTPMAGKPSREQTKAWVSTFQRTPDRVAEANELFEAGVEEARRRTGDELAAAQRGLEEALKGRSREAVVAARARLRAAEREHHRQLRRLGAAESGFVGTPREAVMKQRELDKVTARLQAAKRKQARFEANKNRMPLKPMQEVSPEEFDVQLAKLRASGDELDSIIADNAERTGYIIPQDAQAAFTEWTERVQYAMRTPAELKGIARKVAGLQAAWKRYTLASTRRLFRDTLEDTLLLAVEGVRNPAIIPHTLRLLSMMLHEQRIEGRGTKLARKITSYLVSKVGAGGHGIYDRHGNFLSYRQLRKEMGLVGTTDMGQAHEALRTGVVTPGGEAAYAGARRRFRRPSYGRWVSGLLTANQVRDNLPRVALFLHRRMEGDDFISAGRHVDKVFFDYANLNKTLMVLRRNVAPFVTFLAKSLPLLARYSYERPSYFSFLSKLEANLQQSSGQDPINLAYQRAPTSPDVFNVPSFGGMTEWLGGKPEEGIVWDPQSATRLSALNLLPLTRGGSNQWESAAVASGQLLGGPLVDALGGIYNFDTRRGEAYGDYRNTDPLTFNLIRTLSAGKLAQIDRDPQSPEGLRYRVRSPALSIARALNPYIPGSLGAYSYPVSEALTRSGLVKPVSGADEEVGDKADAILGLQLIEDPQSLARGHQRIIGETFGIPLRPESRQKAMYFFQQRNR